MENNNLNALQCDQVKNYIKHLIDSIPCEKIVEDDSYRKVILVGKPIEPQIATFNKARLNQYFGQDFSGILFEIDKDEMNKIVEENKTRDFMHVFFVNDGNSLKNLNIIFRFSDFKSFKDDTLDLNPKNESAFWLKNNKTQPFTAQDHFKNIKNDYKNGVGATLAAKPNTKLTEYITFDMRDVLEFEGFEHNLKFELIAVEDSNKGRLSIQVYVKESNRIHTQPNIYEGYYDLGHIRP